MRTRVLRTPVTHLPELESGLEEFLLEIASPFGVQSAVEKILSGDPLFQEEALTLPRAPVFLLASLAEIQQRRLGHIGRPHIRPVFLLSLAQWLEESTPRATLARAEAQLRAIDSHLNLPSTLNVALDRWEGHFALSDLLAVASDVLKTTALQHQLTLVGPSTVELHSLQKQAAPSDEREWFTKLFADLIRNDIESIDGGSDFELHALAASQGMKVSVGHDISSFIEAAVYAPISANYEDESFYRVVEERFILELLDIRVRFSSAGNFRAWFPWFRSALHRFHRTTDQAFGAPLLRVMAFARLLLPEARYIRAPVSLFGKSLVQSSVLFGANDLGYAAVDASTAQTLGVPRLSEVSRLIEEDGMFPSLTT